MGGDCETIGGRPPEAPAATERVRRYHGVKTSKYVPGVYYNIGRAALYATSVLLYVVTTGFSSSEFCDGDEAIACAYVQRSLGTYELMVLLSALCVLDSVVWTAAAFAPTVTLTVGRVAGDFWTTLIFAVINMGVFGLLMAPLFDRDSDRLEQLWTPSFLHIWPARHAAILVVNFYFIRKPSAETGGMRARADLVSFGLFLLAWMLTVTLFVERAGIGGSSLEPEDANIYDSLWFTMATISTVGYGDITPTTDFGRAVVMVMIGYGILTLSSHLASLAQARAEYLQTGGRYSAGRGCLAWLCRRPQLQHIVVCAGEVDLASRPAVSPAVLRRPAHSRVAGRPGGAADDALCDQGVASAAQGGPAVRDEEPAQAALLFAHHPLA